MFAFTLDFVIENSPEPLAVYWRLTAVNRGWERVRWFIAAVLLLAAGLKAYQLATTPSLGDGILHARWFNVFVVEFELFFGIWLIFGLLQKLTWLATTVLFSVFVLVSFYKAVSGEASCGCFGNVTVNPWITTVFDLAIILTLLITLPKNNTKRFNITSALLAVGLWILISVPVVSVIGGYEAQTLGEDGVIVGKGNEIILEPERWIGKDFSLMNYIETTELPKQGVWLVLLHNHTCSACQESVKQYTKLAVEFVQKENCPKITLVEVPPFETDIEQKDSPAVHGKLNGKRKWKIKTPVLVLVDNGNVQNVFTNPLDIDLIRAIWGDKR